MCTLFDRAFLPRTSINSSLSRGGGLRSFVPSWQNREISRELKTRGSAQGNLQIPRSKKPRGFQTVI
jgi:hypothetical protein